MGVLDAINGPWGRGRCAWPACLSIQVRAREEMLSQSHDPCRLALDCLLQVGASFIWLV